MIGETIGNFRIVSRLGRGGMGEVYLAEQTSIGTKVAVKLLHAQVSADQEHVTRFFNEARAVQRIQHAGIVKIFDVGFHASGHAYLVMEYLEGESLAQRIQRVGRLHPAEIADLGRQIASVLDATHGAGITHRDLKPDNIFIVPDRELASRQRAKILDFGIAKLSGTLANVSPQTIGTMGTPAYMAPEQWGDASRVDWRADIYSLGCVAFEMACGRPPFVVTTIAEACGKHLNEVPVRATTLVPELPAELDALFAQLLEKKPDDRPQTMELVARRFEAIAAQLGPAPTTPLPSPQATPPSVLPAGTPHHPANPLGETVATGQAPPGTLASGLGATAIPPRAAAAPPTVTPAPTIPPTIAPPRRRRWPAVLLGLALAGGGAAAVMVVKHRRRAATPPAEPYCTITTPPPVLDGESAEPVKLRYAFTPGQRTEVTAITQTKLETTKDGTRIAEDLTLTLEGTVYWVLAEPNEQFSGRLELAKISVDRLKNTSPTSGPEAHETLHWHSDDPGPPPAETAALVPMMSIPITFTIGSRGELITSNLPTIQDALARENASPALRAAFTRDELFRTMFLRLPERPVKVGDTWRATDLVRKLRDAGELSAKLDLRVAQISRDGQQVLLQATPDLHVDLVGTVSLRSKQAALQLWAQFDVGRHDVTATALRGCTRLLLVDANRVETKLEAELLASYDAHPLGVAARPAAPPDAGVIAVAPVDAPPPAQPPPPGDATVIASVSADAAIATAPPPPDAAATPAEPAPDPSSLTANLARALGARQARLSACAPAGGRASVTMTIGSDGRVKSPIVGGLSKAANTCIANAVRGLVVPRAPGGPAFTVSYPLVLTAADAPSPPRRR